MNLTRRSLSLERAKPLQKPTHTRIRSSLSSNQHQHKSQTKPHQLFDKSDQNKHKAWGPSIFKYQKSIAIKQIINDYFKVDESNEYVLQKPMNQFARRTQRYRNQEPLPLCQPQKQDTLMTSVAVQPSLSKTCHSLGWPQRVSNVLPPINQSAEDLEDHQLLLSSSAFSEAYPDSLLLRSSSTFSQAFNPEIIAQGPQVTTFQNEILRMFVIFKDGRPCLRAKEFKEGGAPVLERQLRMKGFGLPTIWRQSTRNSYTFETAIQPPLKDQMSKLGRDDVNPSNIKVRPKPFFKKMASNGFQELKVLLRGFCKDLQKVHGKVINNKITPDNIFLTKSYKLCLAQWGFSSFRDTFNIQNNTFESRIDPILKGKGWLVSPEYLAPQIIDELLGCQNCNIWQSASSPDIWSLGLVVYEFMTLVPIWCYSKCSVVTKINQYPTVRGGQKTGLLGVSGRNLKKLQQKQLQVQKIIQREIQTWPQSSKELGLLILRMCEPRLQHRISWQQLISQL